MRVSEDNCKGSKGGKGVGECAGFHSKNRSEIVRVSEVKWVGNCAGF